MSPCLRAALLGLLALAMLPSSAFAARNVSVIAGTGSTGFTVSDDIPTSTRTYAANADNATIGADTLETDLLTRAVTINTGSTGAQAGTVTVASAISDDFTATRILKIDAASDLTVSAPID